MGFECDSPFIIKRILELCNKDYLDFGKFNSLRNTLTNSRSKLSLSSCLFVTLLKQHLDMYTYKYLLGYLLMFQLRIKSNSIFMLVL